jgi:hypothetical protein
MQLGRVALRPAAITGHRSVGDEAMGQMQTQCCATYFQFSDFVIQL